MAFTAEGEGSLPASMRLADFLGVLRRIPVLATSGAAVPFRALVRAGAGASSDSSEYAARLAGVLSFLRALGILEVTPITEAPDDYEVAYVSERAFDFAISAALCDSQGIEAIGTWQHQYGPDNPPWGVPLVRHMERRRLESAPDPDRVEVVREEEVVAIVIKSKARRGFKTVDVYLCQRDAVSGFYNFIGGKRRRPETRLAAAERKMADEIGLPVGTYRIEPLVPDDRHPVLETRKISNETGVFTKYAFYLYRAVHITGRARRQSSNKWFTETELVAGRGRRKERIMTHEEVIAALRGQLAAAGYANELSDLEVSIPSASALRATPAPNILDFIVDQRELLGALAALASLIFTVLRLLRLI